MYTVEQLARRNRRYFLALTLCLVLLSGYFINVNAADLLSFLPGAPNVAAIMQDTRQVGRQVAAYNGDLTIAEGLRFADKYTYRQRYRFTITTDQIADTGIGLETTYELTVPASLSSLEMGTWRTAQYLLVLYQGLPCYVKVAAAYQLPLFPARFTGIFLPMDRAVAASLPTSCTIDGIHTAIFPYVLDTTQSFIALRVLPLLLALALLAVAGYAVTSAVVIGRDLEQCRLYRDIQRLGTTPAAIDELLATLPPKLRGRRIPLGKYLLTPNRIRTRLQ